MPYCIWLAVWLLICTFANSINYIFGGEHFINVINVCIPMAKCMCSWISFLYCTHKEENIVLGFSHYYGRDWLQRVHFLKNSQCWEKNIKLFLLKILQTIFKEHLVETLLISMYLVIIEGHRPLENFTGSMETLNNF